MFEFDVLPEHIAHTMPTMSTDILPEHIACIHTFQVHTYHVDASHSPPKPRLWPWSHCLPRRGPWRSPAVAPLESSFKSADVGVLSIVKQLFCCYHWKQDPSKRRSPSSRRRQSHASCPRQRFQHAETISGILDSKLVEPIIFRKNQARQLCRVVINLLDNFPHQNLSLFHDLKANLQKSNKFSFW